jgi:hypothetical protein
MKDLYLTESGDLRVGPNGDLALTDDNFRHLGQQAHIRMMTNIGDHLLYPRLGADLQQLYGRPQSQATGEFGKRLIQNALEREGVFSGLNLTIKAVPTGPQAIRFDVFVRSNSGTRLLLSITQNLTPQEI